MKISAIVLFVLSLLGVNADPASMVAYYQSLTDEQLINAFILGLFAAAAAQVAFASQIDIDNAEHKKKKAKAHRAELRRITVPLKDRVAWYWQQLLLAGNARPDSLAPHGIREFSFAIFF